MNEDPIVGLVVSGTADPSALDEAGVILKKFGVAYDEQVLSVHRDPDRVARYATEAETRGLSILICADSRAAHLAGVVAAHTVLPVIGVPLSSGPLGGTDALYATVQMPRGVPVATMALDGAANAAVFAVQILSVSDAALRSQLYTFKQHLAEGLRL